MGYISIVDVAAVLTDSVDPNAYWRKLKQRLKEEGNETVTNCHALKMLAADENSELSDTIGQLKKRRLNSAFSSKDVLNTQPERLQKGNVIINS